MLGWWSQPASFSSPAIKLNPPWNPHQSRWLLLASKKGWWHERREGIGRGVGAIDNGCLFISQNKTAKREQRTINGCYASLICVSFLRPRSWQSLMRAAITVNQTCQVSSEYAQLWKTCLFFFLTDEILLKKSKKIWRVKPTFCTDFLNLFTFLSLMDPSRRGMCLATDAFKGLNGNAVWFCADGRLGRQTDHTVCRNTAY